MDALVAKAAVLDATSKKRKRSYNPQKQKQKPQQESSNSTLDSVKRKTALPASLAVPSAPSTSHSHIRDKKLRAHLRSQSSHTRIAKELVEQIEDPLFDDPQAEGGAIAVEGELERTWRVSQDDIAKNVGAEGAKLRKEIRLDGGPYRVRYTRSGRHLAIIGKKGHAATFDALTGNVHCEIQLKETCRDITFLQDTSFHAIAQRKSAFIYDRDGLEIHRLSSIIEPTRLAFLPYHWLLVSTGLNGHLTYLDTTTGKIVAAHNSHLGPCSVLEQNPQNAVVQMGHRNGTVTFWTPNMSTPVVRLLAHLGPISGLAVWGEDGLGGRTMGTAGVDGIIKIWDARNWKEPLRQWALRKSSSASAPEISFSQRGHVGLTTGSGVNVYVPVPSWTNTQSTSRIAPPLYLTHPFPATTFAPLGAPVFTPFFDSMTIGHTTGFSTLLVPGSAESKWDSTEADPYENVKMRREREVRGLLDKINPALITLDPDFVGTVDAADIPQKRVDVTATPFARLPRIERLKLTGQADLSNEAVDDEDGKGADEGGEGDNNEGEKKVSEKTLRERNKMRGKNKSLKRHLRKKKKNVIDPATIAIRAKIEKQRNLIAQAKRKEKGMVVEEEGGRKSALDRFRR